MKLFLVVALASLLASGGEIVIQQLNVAATWAYVIGLVLGAICLAIGAASTWSEAKS